MTALELLAEGGPHQAAPALLNSPDLRNLVRELLDAAARTLPGPVAHVVRQLLDEGAVRQPAWTAERALGGLRGALAGAVRDRESRP